MRRFRAFQLLLWAPTIVAPAGARDAEHAKARVVVQSGNAANCATAQSLSHAVEQRLHRQVFVDTGNAELEVRISFEQRTSRWHADIELVAANGQALGHRELTSSTGECSTISDSLALVVALMVDLTTEEVEVRTARTPALETSNNMTLASPSPPITTTSATTSPNGPTPRVNITTGQLQNETILNDRAYTNVSLGAVSLMGTLPKMGWGMRLASEWRPRSRWSAQLGLVAVLPVSINDSDSSKARFSLYYAEAGLCVAPAPQMDSLFRLCAGSRFGFVQAVGEGYALNRDSHLTLLTPIVKAESTWWPKGRVGFRVGLGAGAPVFRDRFYATRADGSQTKLFGPPVIEMFLQADVCLRL